MLPLTPKRRSELRAEAHKLKSTVLIGDKGLTDEVLAEIERSLKAHELIKVRAATDERDARDVWLETICERLEAHPVQQIGKVFVIYRENEEDEEGQAGDARPEAKGRARGAASKARKAKPVAAKRRPRTVGRDPVVPAGKRRPRAVGPKAGGAGVERRARTAAPSPRGTTAKRRPRG